MQKLINRYKNQITLLSFILILLAFLFSNTLKDVFLIIATIIAGIPIAIKAFQAIRFRTFSIEMLVTLAVIGAIIIGEYVESAVVTFLFLFGDYLESRTLEKTRASLRELTEMAPDEALVVRNGLKEKIPVEEVVVGDRVIVHSGGKIPVDGKILAGQASINEAVVTGESTPKLKNINDTVFSGTIIDNGYIEMVAEKVGDDTTFAKIIELVEEAQDSKSKTEKFLNKFANIYTPSVVLLSILVFLILRDAHIAITFLVIACPGALVIGVPVSIVAGIGNGAKNGVLIKGGEVIDELAKVDTVLFDKTGTLTKGRPVVTDIHVFSDQDENELLRKVAQAELISEHHLGKTIIKEAENRKIILKDEIPEGEVIKGNGICATVEDEQLIIGNRKLLQNKNILLVPHIESYAIEREKLGNTAIFVAINGNVEAIISIADEIRDDAKDALITLKKSGIKKMYMLTGDNEHTAKLVAKQLNLDGYFAELLPQDKVKYVKRLQEKGHRVAMIGDGINDAPAIATANIGLAMGDGGTDVSMETADVVLMADQLSQFAHAYSLAKATARNMKQNTLIAIGTVFLLLIGVLKGDVHLASGMLIHEASVLLVILNGMRLVWFNQKKKKFACENDHNFERNIEKVN